MSRLTDISRDSRNSNAVRIYCDEQTAIEVKSLEQHDKELLEGFVNELKKRVGKNKFKVFSVSPYCLYYKSFIKELAELLKERGV